MEAIERETYINFSDADETATLCTYNRAWLNRMDKLAAKTDAVQVKTRQDNYGEYLFSKKFVKVNLPRTVSEKEREKLRQFATKRKRKEK